MYPPGNQLQPPDDEEDQPEELEDGDNCKTKDAAIQEPGQDHHHQHFTQDFGHVGQNGKWADSASSAAVLTASTRRKINYGRLMQEGFSLSSPKLKAKKRKPEIIEVHGGRILRSTGRKDRHSKVCTARGPRDRRVRLSPKTAIQFYDVQDRLGYDRPSKAIDWLIKEAKVAIDALDEHPPLAGDNHFRAANGTEYHRPPNGKSQQCGINQKNGHFNDDNSVSGFSFILDGAAAPSSGELQAYADHDFNPSRNRNEAEDAILCPSYQQGFCSALATATTAQILDTNWEMARLHRILTWNCANENSGNGRGGAEYSLNSLPPHFPSQPSLGHSQMFTQREPLQSSMINYSPVRTHFQGFSFSNELSNITAAATMKEDGKEKKPGFSEGSSAASFLHYEE